MLYCLKVWDTRVRESCVRDIMGPYIFGECIDINVSRCVVPPVFSFIYLEHKLFVNL